uniref:F-box associated beta-propeller type 3 domain-containing protein n=1 Tax=Oryza punctata TaxID=4537 RepID=A0A0E0LWB6_ORYPU
MAAGGVGHIPSDAVVEILPFTGERRHPAAVPTSGFALVNPFTGERLDGGGVPPPCPRGEEPPFYQPTHAAYAFGYHPTTGRYKIVHFPIHDKRPETFDAVRVLTLGSEDASWRDVPMPAGGSSRRGSCGVVSVDGATYWVTRDTERVMSLDLSDERVAAVTPLPLPKKYCRYFA